MNPSREEIKGLKISLSENPFHEISWLCLEWLVEKLLGAKSKDLSIHTYVYNMKYKTKSPEVEKRKDSNTHFV